MVVSFLLALIPIIWLIIALGVIKLPAYQACGSGLVITILLAVFAFEQNWTDTLTGALEGVVMGLWPIVFVIIAAVFTFNVTSASKSMEVIKRGLSSITTDKRILVLLIAWGFGGFLEAIAGFGTAVAIPAAILIAFGIHPVKAAVLCLIANTTPTAFGAIGIPVITLAQMSGLDVLKLSFIVTLQLLPLILIIPYVLVALVGDNGIKSIKGVGGITLAAGLSFAVPQILVARFMGAELPAIVGSLICVGTIILLSKMRDKRQGTTDNQIVTKAPTAKQMVIAGMPFILVFIFIIVASPLFPAIHDLLGQVASSFTIYTGTGAKPYVIAWLSTPGTLIILATIIGGMIQGLKFGAVMKIFGSTVKQLTWTIVTVSAIVALAKVMGYSGMISAIATTLVMMMGRFYPLIAPVIGALGTFITGSDTSANVLFAGLQKEAALTLKVDPFWVVSANMVGATAGKMISPQSIAVATAAVGLEGQEGTILKQTLKWCGLYLVVICCYIFLTGLLIGSL